MNFNFQETYLLENDFVLLRPLDKEDHSKLLKFSIEEPVLWEYSLISAAGYLGLQNYINTALNARSQNKEYPFIVFDKRTNEYAGSTRFYDIQYNQDTLQIGYTWYGKNFQGTGLNRHCKYLMLQFAFEEMGVHRVEFRADSKNQRSIAAMKSIGCIVEGTLRSNGYSADGNRRDSIILSILRHEWEENVKEHLFQKLSTNSLSN